MNSRIALTVAVLGLSLTACSAIGARPSGGSGAPYADPSPSPSATESATTSHTATGTPAASPTSTATAKLDGREFVSVLVTENGKSKQLVSGTKVRLGFSDGSISAYAGCNHLSGDYQIKDGSLVVGSMATTEIGCPDDLGAQDQWLGDLLAKSPDVTLNANDLSLAAGETHIDFQDREVAEPDQPLKMITWGLTSILDGDTASSVPEGVMPTLLFMDDGTVQIAFGCNAGGGQYTVDGEVIHFSQIVTTDMACGGDKDDVESAVAAVIDDGDVTFSIDHTTLTLQSADGHGLQYAAAVDVTDY